MQNKWKVMRRQARLMVDSLRGPPWFFIQLRGLITFPRSICQYLYFYGKINIPVSDSASFYINHHGYGFHVENDLFWAGYGNGWEGLSLKIWLELAKEADFIADIGANTGVFALAAAAINPKAKILALEPVPRVFRKLQANIALNPAFAITPLQVAASSLNGEAVMFDVDMLHEYSASLNPTMLGDIATKQVMVPTVTLDTLFQDQSFARIDLMKIDVEKHEPEVIAGALHTLATSLPTMLVEILDVETGGRLQQCADWSRYTILAIHETAGIAPANVLGEMSGNYLFVETGRWQALAPRLKAVGLLA